MFFLRGISIFISCFWLYVCIFCMYWYYGYRAVVADFEESKSFTGAGCQVVGQVKKVGKSRNFHQKVGKSRNFSAKK